MPKLTNIPHLGKAVQDALALGAPDIDTDNLPSMSDLNADNLTDLVHLIDSKCPNPRQKFLMDKLVQHLHDYVRETQLTTEEWMTAIKFLTATGQICTDLRQEFILLSDVLGVSALVDVVNHPKPKGATESTVLGPFFVEETREINNGDTIASEGKGAYMLVKGSVKNLRGEPIPNCLIETWETDNDGFYDTQYAEYDVDCRGRLRTDAKGEYVFRAVLPVAYPIPNDGPVGKWLRSMNRHVFRPAHLHMMLQAQGYEELVTSLYFKGDVFLTSDAVFGVKGSLVKEPTVVTDEAEAKKYGFKSAPFNLVEQDFVLLTEDEAKAEMAKARKERGVDVPA
ncbi:Hydroxyquinol 1,2-dioxygenase [Vanrija pseudolonga]|uniref:Hydroxyquinol 1,2-dioxygenase n=1 Tax=Vanrija pseudolonga TaxID=143232 RepID=A0AAF1BKP6_9TREE|nr:Hydroxyquinol 1,2-dioxygenase [Vanrija pseudolonga]